MNPLVSITTPTYNRASGHLRDAIASALAQTYENIEIIVSDNCSSDNTEELVRSIDDPRVVYHRQETNVGYLRNFNFCVDQARGEYFLMLHDDDLIDPDLVETCVAAAADRPDVGVIHTGVRLIDGDGGLIREIPNRAFGDTIDDFTRCWFEGRKPMYLCNSVFGTKWLQQRGGFHSEYNLYLDVFAQFDLAAEHGWIDIQDVKASVRRHAEEITHTAKITPWARESLLLNEHIAGLAPAAEREAIREQGMHWFARRNYDLSKKVEGWLDRSRAIFSVYRTFGLAYPPPKAMLKAHIGSLLSS